MISALPPLRKNKNAARMGHRIVYLRFPVRKSGPGHQLFDYRRRVHMDVAGDADGSSADAVGAQAIRVLHNKVTAL